MFRIAQVQPERLSKGTSWHQDDAIVRSASKTLGKMQKSAEMTGSVERRVTIIGNKTTSNTLAISLAKWARSIVRWMRELLLIDSNAVMPTRANLCYGF